MRHGITIDGAADPVKAKVGNMMLPARVEAAAYLDAQVFDGRVHFEGLLAQPAAQLAREPARRSDAELAGIGPRTRGNIDNGAGVRLSQANTFERAVELRQVRFAHPAEEDVLLHGGADRVFNKAMGDPRQVA